MNIHPRIIVTPNGPTVQFREPFDTINLAEYMPKLLKHMSLEAGTYFHLQFMTWDMLEVLRAGHFLVQNSREKLEVVETTLNHTNTRTVAQYRAEQIGDWQLFGEEKMKATTQGQIPAAEVNAALDRAVAAVQTVLPVSSFTVSASNELDIRWNPGRKHHEVVNGDGDVLASFTSEQGGKDAAQAFVASAQRQAA